MRIGIIRKTKCFVAGLMLLMTMMGLPIVTQAATITADFSGDGINDIANFAAGSGVFSITRGGSGAVYYYYGESNWMTAHAVNTNGVVGQELVIIYASGYVQLIENRINAERAYYVLGNNAGQGSRLLSFAELNGAAGVEILFTYAGGHVSVIDDRLRTSRDYTVFHIGWGGSTRYLKIAEFNGVAGNEIMFSYQNGISLVVDDRLRTIRTYTYQTSGAAPTYANVDGVAGLEAIIKYGTRTYWIVDRTRSVVMR